MNATRLASQSSVGPRKVWHLTDGGNVNAVATKVEDGKVTVRLLADYRGTAFYRYDDNFKMIEAGRVPSIKDGMEKFNA